LETLYSYLCNRIGTEYELLMFSEELRIHALDNDHGAGYESLTIRVIGVREKCD